jgi:hypothetical protein
MQALACITKDATASYCSLTLVVTCKADDVQREPWVGLKRSPLPCALEPSLAHCLTLLCVPKCGAGADAGAICRNGGTLTLLQYQSKSGSEVWAFSKSSPVAFKQHSM